MTEEEKAEEYTNNRDCYVYDCEGNGIDITGNLRQAHLDGIAEGRKEKWHDLRKNPDDLPKHSGLYCVQCGEVREYVKEEKSWFTVHFEPCMNRTEETYLWCELPKFEG